MSKVQSSEFRAQSYKNILIVRLDRMGDVILSTPVIKALRDAYPESRITFLARPYTREIVEGNPNLDEVLVYDKDGSEKGFIGNLKFAFRLRKLRFDIALALHPTNRTHILVYLAGIPRRVGYDRKLGFLLTKRIPHTKQFGLRHEKDYSLSMLKYIGIEPKGGELYIPVNPESERRTADIFSKSGIKDTDIVVSINPGASCPSRRWSRKKYAEAADAIQSRYGVKIIIMVGKNDKVFGDEVASMMSGECVNLSGLTSIGDIVSVLKRTDLLISNDSGPVHVAGAVGTPVIAIFGRNDRGISPVRWGPVGEKDIVLHKDLGCDVCLAHNCKVGFKCLDAITVEDVLAAADKILGK